MSMGFNCARQSLVILLSILTLPVLSQPAAGAYKVLPEITVSSTEWEIYQQINKYRTEKRLPAVPLSGSLTYVAQQHVRDLADHDPISGRCNLHSWSSKGPWSPCCYTGDHAHASCMWNKPRELTNYDGEGYEIAYWTNEPLDPKPFAARALLKWKQSPEHNSVIINTHEWDRLDWKAMGVGFYKGYLVVWFGAEADNDTETRAEEK